MSDSCSSDHTLSTPPSEYPCGVIDPFLTNDTNHEYEQIRFDNSSHYYCLVYCRHCANYHQTSSTLCRQSSFNRSACTCHLRNDNHHLFELQPMLRTNSENLNH